MKNTRFWAISSAASLIFTGCAEKQTDSQSAFWDEIQSHCGKAYAGSLVSNDEADIELAGKPMVMHVDACTPKEIQIPFVIGDNRSRTWFLTRQESGLRLKHRHNHEDGQEDVVSQYGGDTQMPGTSTRQAFPVDSFSKDLFAKEGLNVSMTNVWAMEITDKRFAYELNRENRHFRVEFDLTEPIAPPPAPW